MSSGFLLLFQATLQSFVEGFFFYVISYKNNFTLPDFAIEPGTPDFYFAVWSYRLKNNFMCFTFQIKNAFYPVDLIATEKQKHIYPMLKFVSKQGFLKIEAVADQLIMMMVMVWI